MRGAVCDCSSWRSVSADDDDTGRDRRSSCASFGVGGQWGGGGESGGEQAIKAVALNLGGARGLQMAGGWARPPNLHSWWP